MGIKCPTMLKAVIFLVIAGVCLAEIELPTNLNLNSLDDIPFVKDRCEKKGSTDTYERIKQAANETRTCLEGKINPIQVKSELDEAKKTGSMDEVFGKYCKKRPEIKDCILKTVNISKECLEESEKSALDNAIRIIDEILDFACFRDGDRLAMFVAEGGLECINSRTEKVQECVNSTLKIDTSSFSLSTFSSHIPSLSIDKEKCDNFAKIQECVVTDLETNCKDTTPANIVDALFKFVKKTTCKNIKRRRSVSRSIIKLDIEKQLSKIVDISSISEKLQTGCTKNGGDNALGDLWYSLNETKNCFGQYKFLSTPKNEFLGAIRNCTSKLVQAMENCLADDAKYYPSFFVNSVLSLVEFGYDNHADALRSKK